MPDPASQAISNLCFVALPLGYLEHLPRTLQRSSVLRVILWIARRQWGPRRRASVPCCLTCIADDTYQSKRSVRRAIALLEQGGVVRRTICINGRYPVHLSLLVYDGFEGVRRRDPLEVDELELQDDPLEVDELELQDDPLEVDELELLWHRAQQICAIHQQRVVGRWTELSEPDRSRWTALCCANPLDLLEQLAHEAGTARKRRKTLNVFQLLWSQPLNRRASDSFVLHLDTRTTTTHLWGSTHLRDATDPDPPLCVSGVTPEQPNPCETGSWSGDCRACPTVAHCPYDPEIPC